MSLIASVRDESSAGHSPRGSRSRAKRPELEYSPYLPDALVRMAMPKSEAPRGEARNLPRKEAIPAEPAASTKTSDGPAPILICTF